MSVNPYAPPTTTTPNATPTEGSATEEVAWFSPRQVGIGTFFGGPLAAGLLLRENARAVRDESGAQNALWGGIGGTALLLVLALFVLPDNVPGTVIGGATALAAHSMTKQQWARRTASHPTPRTAETRRVVKISLLSMGVLLVVILLVVGVGVGFFPDAEVWQE